MRPEATEAPDAGRRRRPWSLVLAAATLLRLELKVMTGNRAIVLAAVEAAWLAAFAIMAHLRDSPWDVESFYNRTLLVPALVPAIALAMVAVMGDRDSRQLEVTFVSAGGRHAVWSFRFVAILLACIASAAGLAAGTWLFIDRDFEPVAATLHAITPIAFVAALTLCASVAFRSESVGGLVGVIPVVGSVFLHGGGPNRFDLFLNPFVPPDDLIVGLDWVRLLFWHHALYLLATALLFAGALHLLQRRERLL